MATNELDLLIGDYVLEKAGQPVRELSVNMDHAARKKPDYEAELQKLSQRVGVPLETARAVPDEIKRQAVLKDIDAEFLQSHFPATANFIRPQENADIAVDDLQSLKKHEALFQMMGDDWIGKYKAASENDRMRMLTQARTSVSRGTPEQLKELGAKSRDVGEESFAGRAIGAFGAGVAGIGGNIVYPALQLAAELQSEIIGKPLVATGLVKRDPFAGMVEETTRWRKTFNDYIKSIGGARKGDDLVTSSVLSGFQSAGANIPTMAGAIVAAPALGIQAAANLSLNLMGAGTAGQAFGQARDQGVGTFEAIPFAVSQGIVEKYTERLPATKLLEGLGLNQGWKGALRLFGSQLFHENWTEQVATALQDLNEWAILPENNTKTVNDYLTERPNAALQTLIATTVGTVLQTGAAKGIDTAINRAERQRNRLFFESLGQEATANKVRGRAPERYRQFVDEAVKNGPLESIRIPIERFREYFQTQDLSPDTVASELGANNYQEAILSGGDVAIPLGTFAEKIAPTPHLEGLMADLRLGNGLTEREEAEADDQDQAKVTEMVTKMAALVKEQEAIAPIDAAIEEIVRQTEGQLVAAATDPSTARDQATVMRGVAILANRAFPNLDPLDAAKQVWEHYGITITREAPGFEQRNELLEAFSSDPNLRANFDDLMEIVRGGQFAETQAPTIADMALRLRALSNKSGRTARKAGAVGVRSDQAAFDKAQQAEFEDRQAKEGDPGQDDIPFDVPETDLTELTAQAGKLAAYLKAAGVDIEGKTNDQVFELVRQEAGRTLFQSVPAQGGAFFYPDEQNKEVAERFIATGRTLDFASDQELMAIAKTDRSFHSAIREEVANRENIRGGRDVGLDRIDFEAGNTDKRGAKSPDYIMGVKARSSQTFFQGDATPEKLGFTRLLESGKIKIGLLAKADMSTFLHESGHLYLEVMGDLAAIPEASQQIKDDYATILKFLKVDSREQVKTEQHEKFARANEKYLMEGKAPSPELRGVFQRFRAWLKFIYERVRRDTLPDQLNDNLREVFDRIYATDAEIMRATQELGSVQMITTPELVGWTPEQFELYTKAIADEVETAKEELQQKLLAEYAREAKKVWKDERKKVEAKVTEDSNLMPVYLAFNDLTAGKMLAGEPAKLRTHSILLHYGEDAVKALPKSVHAADGNLDADTAAAFFGFNTGEDLVKALGSMVSQKRYIAGRVKQIMAERHGDMLIDGTIQRRAMEAMHNEARLKVLRMEQRALKNKVAEVEPFIEPLKEQIKQGEKERAYENRFRDAEEATRRAQARAATEQASPALYRRAAKEVIDAAAPRKIVPGDYIRASKKASRAAFVAMSKGDYVEAAIQNQHGLQNHYLYLEAVKARDEIDKIVKYAKKFDTDAVRKAMGKAQIGGGDYLVQIDNILNRYEFRKVPIVELERRETLSEWIARETLEGRHPAIDPVLVDEARRINFASVPMTELRAIYDAVRNIEHLAREVNKLSYKKMKVDFAQAKAELTDAAANNLGLVVGQFSDSAKPRTVRLREYLQSWDSMLNRPEMLFMWLDGDNVDGPWHRYIWNPLKESQHALNDDMKKIAKAMEQIVTGQSRDWQNSLRQEVKLDARDILRTRKDLIGIALNLGNEKNRRLALYSLEDRDIHGNILGGGAERLDRVLQKLNAQDWAFVQKVWDMLDTMRPEIGAIHKRLTGLELQWVEATPFTTVDEGGNEHQLKGGYFPLVAANYERVQSLQQADIFEESYTHATTSHGFTIARTGATYALDFNWDKILTSHLAKVVKDYTHREAVLAANKILNDPEIRRTLGATLGENHEVMFRQWLKDIANDTNRNIADGMSAFDRAFTTTRANVVAAAMGFKATVHIMQLVSGGVSMDRVHPKYLHKALLQFMYDGVAMTREAREESGELRNRAQTMDRDIGLQLDKLAGKNTLLANAQRWGFWGIGFADGITATVTYQGAKAQALAEGKGLERAILEAEAAVRLTQGAGSIMDQAAVSRSRNGFLRMATMFYGYMSAQYAIQRDIAHQVKGVVDLPKALAREFFVILVPLLLAEAIVLRGPVGDDDPEWSDYATWALRKAMLAPFMTVPFARDAASAIDYAIEHGKSNDLRFTPIFTFLEKAYRFGSKAYHDHDKQRDIDVADYSVRAAEVLGYALGVPGTAQGVGTYLYLKRVDEGQQRAPDNPGLLALEALVGKQK